MSAAPSPLLLAALSAAARATADLGQTAYEGGLPSGTLHGDTVPQLADALKMTIEHATAIDDLPASDAEGVELIAQLQHALGRFLEGWAG